MFVNVRLKSEFFNRLFSWRALRGWVVLLRWLTAQADALL
jgi:hypothetical protein